MSKRVLISTLGETPSVVTEAIDVLIKDGKKPNEVFLITTTDSNSTESLNFLIEHIENYYNNSITPIPRQLGRSYEDITDIGSVLEFMNICCNKLKEYRNRNYKVYVCIAGGRKTMSALMTLAVQFIGAAEIFHIIITDKDLEKKSNINHIRAIKSNIKELEMILHPKKDKIIIIQMPFIGLFPWLSDIIKKLNNEPTNNKAANDLVEMSNLFENGQITETGKLFKKIIGGLEFPPEPCKNKEYLKASQIDHHYNNDIANMANNLINRFSFICGAQPIEWGGSKGVKISDNDITFHWKNRSDVVLGLKLITTAKTNGERNMIKRELENFLNKNK